MSRKIDGMVLKRLWLRTCIFSWKIKLINIEKRHVSLEHHLQKQEYHPWKELFGKECTLISSFSLILSWFGFEILHCTFPEFLVKTCIFFYHHKLHYSQQFSKLYSSNNYRVLLSLLIFIFFCNSEILFFSNFILFSELFLEWLKENFLEFFFCLSGPISQKWTFSFLMWDILRGSISLSTTSDQRFGLHLWDLICLILHFIRLATSLKMC